MTSLILIWEIVCALFGGIYSAERVLCDAGLPDSTQWQTSTNAACSCH
jgi:hypothetical protein